MHSRAFSLLALALATSIPTVLSAQESPRHLVVIDAGHGGVDPGARGPDGTLEKDVTLAVARELAARLGSDPSLEVRLTRDADTLIPLNERTRLANQWRDAGGSDRPALFLSIHANAHQQHSVRGFETYFLAEARTEDARRVAAFENSAQRFEEVASEDDPLGFILTDLRQNHYLRESSDAAALFQRHLATLHSGPDRGVKQASFVVLEGTFMPAILVELAFITNPADETMLTSRDYRTRVAAELAKAVADYFRE